MCRRRGVGRVGCGVWRRRRSPWGSAWPGMENDDEEEERRKKKEERRKKKEERRKKKEERRMKKEQRTKKKEQRTKNKEERRKKKEERRNKKEQRKTIYYHLIIGDLINTNDLKLTFFSHSLYYCTNHPEWQIFS